MQIVFEASRVLLIVSFLAYGLICVLTDRMVQEFERYGLPGCRKIIGAAEVAGAIGLAAGYFFPLLGVCAAAGLCLLMVGAVLTRIRLQDSLSASFPAVFLLGLSVFVLLFCLQP